MRRIFQSKCDIQSKCQREREFVTGEERINKLLWPGRIFFRSKSSSSQSQVNPFPFSDSMDKVCYEIENSPKLVHLLHLKRNWTFFHEQETLFDFPNETGKINPSLQGRQVDLFNTSSSTSQVVRVEMAKEKKKEERKVLDVSSEPNVSFILG